jgi:hypothetical protein
MFLRKLGIYLPTSPHGSEVDDVFLGSEGFRANFSSINTGLNGRLLNVRLCGWQCGETVCFSETLVSTC